MLTNFVGLAKTAIIIRVVTVLLYVAEPAKWDRNLIATVS